MKKSNIIVTLLLVLGLISLTVGISVAFFNYTRTGDENTLSVGRISFISRQTKTISLTNIFPIDPEEPGIMNDETKVGTVEIEIIGDTDYSNGVEYLISSSNAHVYTNTGKTIPISIDITVTNLGTESNTYFVSRNSKNANLYKKMSGNSIIGDQSLLVGYIKPNTTSGTAEGVNGKISIKAYLDKNKIGISDTYDGTESGNNGTTNEWANDRTILTTTEWNAFQSTELSFQIRIEANEGIWVNEPFYNTLLNSAVMDNIRSTNVLNDTGIDFSKTSGDTDDDNIIDNGKGLYIRKGTESNAYPIVYYRGDVDNNIVFANKCWNIVRTTETGGIKLIYNGETTGTIDNPACENTTGTDRQITLNINDVDTNTFYYIRQNAYSSPAYMGYMYGSIYEAINEAYTEGAYFGNSFTYDTTNNVYTLVDTRVGVDENHHYTCNLTTSNGTCASIRYYITYTSGFYLYFSLSNGKSISDALAEMDVNTNDSDVKEKVDMWYQQSISNTDYEEKIEDTIYCNDRGIYLLGGLNPNGGLLDLSSAIDYATDQRMIVTHNPSVKCTNRNDSFTVSNQIGNGELSYPVGLINSDEILLAGAVSRVYDDGLYLKTGESFWTMSPVMYMLGYATVEALGNNGKVMGVQTDQIRGIRPVISLKSGISITSGTGTPTNPYIIN